MDITKVLNEQGFRFSKRYGQNFLTDKNLLAAIAADAGVTEEDTVVEIGAGAGTLTRAIAERAKRVVAFEIDRRLEPVLRQTLSGLDNVEPVFADALSVRLSDYVSGPFKAVANLPYYITTPVMFHLLESEGLTGLTVMVQREVAERICAEADTPAYGALSVAVQTRGSARLVRQVGRSLFLPPPNVDSAVVRVDIAERPDILDRKTLGRTIRAGFAMRRKTLANNLIGAFGLTREEAEFVLARAGLDRMARGETLTPDRYIILSNELAKFSNAK